jgi:hypothetical protein
MIKFIIHFNSGQTIERNFSVEKAAEVLVQALGNSGQEFKGSDDFAKAIADGSSLFFMPGEHCRGGSDFNRLKCALLSFHNID